MIIFYNRRKETYEIERVAGEKMLRWTYSSPIGMKFTEVILKKKMCSSLYGWYLNRRFSRNKINSFISKFEIDMTQAEKQEAKDYRSFNDFFYRKLKPNAREINPNDQVLISVGDGKILAYEDIDLNQLVQVKGFTYGLKELIKNDQISHKYSKGTCLILRLCPTDYHRFHFFDGGTCESTLKIKGVYYSVNPMALQKIDKLFCENKREWSLFHSDHFGDALYIEVGATGVGSIVQTYRPYQRVERGDEKGYFKFGGSTVILFFKPGQVKIDRDILEQTSLGYESFVLMGDKIGVSLTETAETGGCANQSDSLEKSPGI